MKKITVALLILAFTLPALAVEPIFQKSGLAIRGYDPVAYFELGEARRGDRAWSHEFNDATWLFATREHRDRFAAMPERYLPAYGGYCAWAVSRGDTAPIDPEAWRIVDERLYLNYSASIQKKWERDVPGNIAKADANWPELLAR